MERYERLKILGVGSFGKVYLMRHRDERRLVCAKIIRIKNLSRKEREACRTEVELMKRLHHPNIVGYKDSFLTPRKDHLCIVMEYCDGGDLSIQIKNARRRLFPESKILHWFVQIALGLHYMHGQRVLHRDLKTQNIFLLGNGRLVLGDLGISKILEGTMDFASTRIGTPYYMSPEIFTSKPYNHKSDVWALGCVLYEMTALSHAFDASSINELANRVAKGRYPSINIKYSRSLRDLIGRMLATSPEERPDLDQILQEGFIRKHIHDFLADIVSRESHKIGEGTKVLKAAAVNMLADDEGPHSPRRVLAGQDKDLVGLGSSQEMLSLKKQMQELGLQEEVKRALEPPETLKPTDARAAAKAAREQAGALQREEERRKAVESALARLRHEREERLRLRRGYGFARPPPPPPPPPPRQQQPTPPFPPAAMDAPADTSRDPDGLEAGVVGIRLGSNFAEADKLGRNAFAVPGAVTGIGKRGGGVPPQGQQELVLGRRHETRGREPSRAFGHKAPGPPSVGARSRERRRSLDPRENKDDPKSQVSSRAKDRLRRPSSFAAESSRAYAGASKAGAGRGDVGRGRPYVGDPSNRRRAREAERLAQRDGEMSREAARKQKEEALERDRSRLQQQKVELDRRILERERLREQRRDRERQRLAAEQKESSSPAMTSAREVIQHWEEEKARLEDATKLRNNPAMKPSQESTPENARKYRLSAPSLPISRKECRSPWESPEIVEETISNASSTDSLCEDSEDSDPGISGYPHPPTRQASRGSRTPSGRPRPGDAPVAVGAGGDGERKEETARDFGSGSDEADQDIHAREEQLGVELQVAKLRCEELRHTLKETKSMLPGGGLGGHSGGRNSGKTSAGDDPLCSRQSSHPLGHVEDADEGEEIEEDEEDGEGLQDKEDEEDGEGLQDKEDEEDEEDEGLRARRGEYLFQGQDGESHRSVNRPSTGGTDRGKNDDDGRSLVGAVKDRCEAGDLGQDVCVRNGRFSGDRQMGEEPTGPDAQTPGTAADPDVSSGSGSDDVSPARPRDGRHRAPHPWRIEDQQESPKADDFVNDVLLRHAGSGGVGREPQRQPISGAARDEGAVRSSDGFDVVGKGPRENPSGTGEQGEGTRDEPTSADSASFLPRDELELRDTDRVGGGQTSAPASGVDVASRYGWESPPPAAPAGRLADRILALRERCRRGLGMETFERAYDFLKEQEEAELLEEGGDAYVEDDREQKQMKGLTGILGQDKIHYYRLLDQLIFIENTHMGPR